MPTLKPIRMKPIGFVKTTAAGDEVKDKNRTSEIVINPELMSAIEGIAGFSHYFVLFWLNEITTAQKAMLKVHPRGREDMPLLGVYATRTNLRPNPIGLTLVELLRVDRNVLLVRGLDAFNGTPVLDIKPFDTWDIAKNATMPNWWQKLENEKKKRV